MCCKDCKQSRPVREDKAQGARNPEKSRGRQDLCWQGSNGASCSSVICCLRNEWREQNPERRGRSRWCHRGNDQESLQRTQDSPQALRESTSFLLSSISSSIVSIKSDIFSEFNSDSIMPRQMTMSASIDSS